MLKLFIPNLMIENIYVLNPEYFQKKGIKYLFLDIDNTMVPEYEEYPDEKLVEWINLLKSQGLEVCIISNGLQKRVEKFNERLGLPYIVRARKPRREGFMKAIQIVNAKPEESAIIGDQIFTDVLGGNIMGFYTILTKPIDKREIFAVRIKRILEWFVFKLIIKNKEYSDYPPL